MNTFEYTDQQRDNEVEFLVREKANMPNVSENLIDTHPAIAAALAPPNPSGHVHKCRNCGSDTTPEDCDDTNVMCDEAQRMPDCDSCA
mgnify:CR=1 FL=1